MENILMADKTTSSLGAVLLEYSLLKEKLLDGNRQSFYFQISIYHSGRDALRRLKMIN